MKKYPKLLLSPLLDTLGYVSIILPPFDFIWAPLSGLIMTKLYKGKVGKIAGVFAFLEEAIPFTDVVPTFSVMWVYTYIIKSRNNTKIIK
ncbi:hypothetical protein [uncultured Winogradskyella sp.]|uniref:hypothetical protein n=1 Tax=uncultured Winogradskyella sp. TaxID=395353 RepID=UPI0025EE63DC|nr:hypothetical protein [uncultured Winogradskyella sp.]